MKKKINNLTIAKIRKYIKNNFYNCLLVFLGILALIIGLILEIIL